MADNETIDITSEHADEFLTIQKAMHDSKYLDPSNPPTMEEILDSRIKGRGEILKLYKPGVYNLSNPEVQYNLSWQQYMSSLFLHGKPKNKKGTKRFDTSKERRREVSHLISYLKHIPTTVDLEKAFPVLSDILSNGFRKIIDEDLKSLSQK